MSSLGLKDCYVGSQAQTLRGILSINHPIRQGVVQDWDDLETIWDHILQNELKTEASAQPLLITQQPLASQEDETKMAEILMEKMQVPAMFIANKSVMSLYGGGNMTGISVDSGHDTTYLGTLLDCQTDIRNQTPTKYTHGLNFIKYNFKEEILFISVAPSLTQSPPWLWPNH